MNILSTPQFKNYNNYQPNFQGNSRNLQCAIDNALRKSSLTDGDMLELSSNVFTFILIITLILNYFLANVNVDNFINGNKFIQPVIAAFVGLIPNCAVSIGLTMMLIKGTISFGAVMSGLLSNAGLGLLVLLKNNDFKDTVKIVLILLLISIISGVVINFIY